jgi:WD40 repeat protein
MFKHEGPVLSVCWNKVRCYIVANFYNSLILLLNYECSRKVTRCFLEAWTRCDEYFCNSGIQTHAFQAARMFDVQTGQATQVASHDDAIKCVRWVDAQGGILATGSWDKTIRVFDSSYAYVAHTNQAIVLGSSTTNTSGKSRPPWTMLYHGCRLSTTSCRNSRPPNTCIWSQ